jgi:hypothetical protein
LRGAVAKGLQAVRARDRERFHSTDARNIRGGVNLDEALGRARPDEPRWDYVVGVRGAGRNDHAAWAELHPASSLHVEEVLRKLRWLKAWLAAEAPALRALPSSFHWVATGSVAFRRGGREEKLLAQAGLHFPVRLLKLDEFATPVQRPALLCRRGGDA